MVIGLASVIYPVKNLDAAKAAFERLLGMAPSVDTPYYVQFDVAGERIGLDPNGHSLGFTGAVAFWTVENLEDSLQALLESGGEVLQSASDIGDGSLMATVKDSDGNIIGMIQPPA